MISYFLYPLLIGLLIFLSYRDVKTLEIPDHLNILAWVTGCSIGVLHAGYYQTFIVTFVCIGIMTMIRFVFSSLLQKEVMGEADILIVGTIGAVLGIYGAFLSLFIASLSALIVATALRRYTTPLPFVPFLVWGGLWEAFNEYFMILPYGYM